MLYYSGIGARTTPPDKLNRCIGWGYRLAKWGLTLRSGGAVGADTAFETGCDKANGANEIYLPWKNFNGSNSNLHYISIEAFETAEEIYGANWQHLKPSVQKLMARNMQQVMGENLDEPSEFVLCWTPDSCTTRSDRSKDTGGTGQAIAYADSLDIPIFNLQSDSSESDLIDYIIKNMNSWGITL